MGRTEGGLTAAALADEVGRLADRLRSMSDARLGQSRPPSGSRAIAALNLAQRLADAAQGVEERQAPESPRRRVVPDLGFFALGDQIAVTGTDLVAAVEGLPATEPVWGAGGLQPLADVLAELSQAVRALRLAL